MSILSNYTPDCLVRAYVECEIKDLQPNDSEMSAEKFAWKFQKAIEIAKVDEYQGCYA